MCSLMDICCCCNDRCLPLQCTLPSVDHWRGLKVKCGWSCVGSTSMTRAVGVIVRDHLGEPMAAMLLPLVRSFPLNCRMVYNLPKTVFYVSFIETDAPAVVSIGNG
jgi:hypothetical protein